MFGSTSAVTSETSASGDTDSISSMLEPPKFLKDLGSSLRSMPTIPIPDALKSLAPGAATGSPGDNKHQDRLTLAWAISSGINDKTWEKRWSALKCPEKPRVLILMSETGGGHKASALSISEALEKIAPGQLQVTVTDVFVEHTNFPFNKFPKMYQWFSSKPQLWDAVYKTSQLTSDSILGWEEPLALAWDADFQKCIEKENPDIIVSVHPLCQDAVARVCRRIAKWKSGRKVPFVTCITDLGEGHPFWFHRDVDKCFVPGKAVFDDGIKNQLEKEQLALHGLPIREGFWNVDTSTAHRSELRVNLEIEDVPTVLVVGGGDGMGSLFEVAKSVGSSIPDDSERRQMVVVCGKNEDVKKKLERHPWSKNLSVRILGFVTNMDEWMLSSTAIVTKAGPGTIAEATVCGLPIMISGFLPGQEEANVTYVVDGHMGEYRPEPKDLGQRVKAWLSDPALIEMMSANSKRAARPTASLDIAREILEVMTEHARPLEDGEAGKFSPLRAPSPAATSPVNPEQAAAAAAGLGPPFPSGEAQDLTTQEITDEVAEEDKDKDKDQDQENKQNQSFTSEGAGAGVADDVDDKLEAKASEGRSSSGGGEVQYTM